MARVLCTVLLGLFGLVLAPAAVASEPLPDLNVRNVKLAVDAKGEARPRRRRRARSGTS
jgi:hypothetical protein